MSVKMNQLRTTIPRQPRMPSTPLRNCLDASAWRGIGTSIQSEVAAEVQETFFYLRECILCFFLVKSVFFPRCVTRCHLCNNPPRTAVPP